jgi:hypothetical protein
MVEIARVGVARKDLVSVSEIRPRMRLKKLTRSLDLRGERHKRSSIEKK